MIARVTIYPRREILDPQGKAIRDALARVGFPDVEEVRAGKSFEIRLKVAYNRTDATYKLQFGGDYDTNHVEHTELGPLMDEVYRRFSFDEKAQLVKQTAAQSLFAVTDQSGGAKS